ncbi:MAG: glucosylceramidase, partial [Cyclobacteriaceae bacterium]|nr:glucosylceramidase [Cyclobacteriaceae bacterium]
MKKLPILLLASLALACSKHKDPYELWLTDPKAGILMKEVSDQEVSESPVQTILIDPETSFQAIDGFGYTLSQGSAKHLLAMSDSARNSILQELFGSKGNSIGVSYLRISVAASDLNDFPFSYNDLQDSLATDPELENFSLSYDTLDVLPVLKEILQIHPDLQIMASPWSPP